MSNLSKGQPSPSVIKLVVKGSHVPSFKNNKMLARGRLITNPKNQKWMEGCANSFVSQLFLIAQTVGDGTWTAAQQHFWTALYVPEDDSTKFVSQIRIEHRQVERGNEGAEIIIERI